MLRDACKKNYAPARTAHTYPTKRWFLGSILVAAVARVTAVAAAAESTWAAIPLLADAAAAAAHQFALPPKVAASCAVLERRPSSAGTCPCPCLLGNQEEVPSYQVVACPSLIRS